MSAFEAPKSRVNNKPTNVSWMTKESRQVAILVLDAHIAWLRLNQFLARLPAKNVDRAPIGFKGAHREFGSNWAKPVDKALTETAIFEELAESIDRLPEGVEDPYRPDFDPVRESPSDLVGNAFLLAESYAEEDSNVGDEQRKALQAWSWFEETVGLDLREMARRWRLIEPIFVPAHVSNAYGRTEPGSLHELLDQAVRAYVFGASTAAIAMCRSLTELVLRNHFGCEGGDLENLIMFAEAKPRFFWMRELGLQEKRSLANKALHQYRRIADDAVVDYLRALKELIERAPNLQPGAH